MKLKSEIEIAQEVAIDLNKKEERIGEQKND